MRISLAALGSAIALALACKGGATAPDPKSLYRLDAAAEPATVAPGSGGIFRIAVRPTREGAHVKPETPFHGTLDSSGPIRLEKREIAYADRARVENGGPVFEVPFSAIAAGEGSLRAELVFFVCTEQACMRTTENVDLPVHVREARD